MKKAVALTALIITLLTFTSCGGLRSAGEIRNRLIIQGIGFDKGKDGGIEVCFQVLNTDAASNASGNSTPEQPVKCYFTSGKTLSECLEQLSRLTGKNPLMSQNRIVVFSQELCREGIGRLLDSFIRNNENRINVCAAVSSGSAREIISASSGSNVIPARECEQIIKNSGLEVPKTAVYEISNCLCDGYKSAVLPVLTAEKKDDRTQITIRETAVFNGDRIRCILPTDISKGIAFLDNWADYGTLTLDTDNKRTVSLKILKSQTDTALTGITPVPYFTIGVVCDLAITEISEGHAENEHSFGIDEIRSSAEAEIKKYIQDAVKECIINNRTDPSGMIRRIKRSSPDYFKMNEGRARELLAASQFSVSVTVNIKRAGDKVIIP